MLKMVVFFWTPVSNAHLSIDVIHATEYSSALCYTTVDVGRFRIAYALMLRDLLMFYLLGRSAGRSSSDWRI